MLKFKTRPQNYADWLFTALLPVVLAVGWIVIHVLTYMDNNTASLMGDAGYFYTGANVGAWASAFFIVVLPAAALIFLLQNIKYPGAWWLLLGVSTMALIYFNTGWYEKGFSTDGVWDTLRARSNFGIAPLFWFTPIIFFVVTITLYFVANITRFAHEVMDFHIKCTMWPVLQIVLFIFDVYIFGNNYEWLNSLMYYSWWLLFFAPFLNWIKVFRAIFNTPVQSDIDLAIAKAEWDETHQNFLEEALEAGAKLQEKAVSSQNDVVESLDKALKSQARAAQSQAKVAESQARADESQAKAAQSKAKAGKARSGKLKIQAENDAKKARIDAEKAAADVKQANADFQQAEEDAIQAEEDAKQAELDKTAAEAFSVSQAEEQALQSTIDKLGVRPTQVEGAFTKYRKKCLKSVVARLQNFKDYLLK